MVGAGTGAAGGAGGAGSTQALGAGAMKQLDAVTSTDSASGSGAAGPTEPSPGHPGGAVDDSSRNPASALPDADATGASAGGQATPQPAATSRRLRTAGEAGPPDADIVSAPTPSPTPTIEAAATGSNAADTSADAGETAAAAAAAPAVAAPAPAAQAPPLSPSPAPALLRAVRSPLQRERASAPAPAVPADPSPLPQRASPCASGSRSGIAPSSSATTEQEQLRLAEQLPSLLTPMLALDEAPQPQWASPPPPPALQQQERQEQAQEHDAHGAAPRQRAPGGEAAPAAPGTAATAPRAAAAAARSADRAAVAEEVVISRLPMKEQVPHEPRPLGSAFASSPFSQLMGALPVARLLAPTPPSNPLQLRLASAAAARNVQGALRPRRAAALAVHTPPQARSSPSCGPPTSASTAEAAGAAVQPLLSRGARAGISADDGATRSAGAGAGGGGGGGACMIAGGRGQHLRQAVRLARILATFRGNTLRAFRPAAAPLARSLQAAAAPELSSTDTNGDGPAGAAGEGVPPGAARSDPSGSGAPAAWAPGLAPADGAAAGAAMRTGSTPGEAEGIRWQAVREPTALEAWPPESQELKRPPKPAAALPTQHDGDPVAASCKAGLDVQDSAAERARSGGQQCVSAAVAVAGDGAVEMESACAESGGGVVEGGRRPGTAMLSVAGSEVVDGGGNSWGEQRTAWGGLSLAFLADVFNSAQ
ncbi:hypothetical protein HXX76_008244 [Chlamydomonas incerta]|uniref:Uncharacterized protein n=1 Tax=Chlamydomonas incerta TaxID=51695 RepID=A0A835SY40_CHLIN|nr:hypothetical protein HXX76_008244 [Chlamydomonas incerta]|eukprot:KAG2433891.1 hypothetical protein HXX76_008244 [Chlamydomonas incerta]